MKSTLMLSVTWACPGKNSKLTASVIAAYVKSRLCLFAKVVKLGCNVKFCFAILQARSRKFGVLPANILPAGQQC
jgi:hypothetical protein